MIRLNPAVHLLVVSAHAPIEAAEADAKSVFYQDLENAIQNVHNHYKKRNISLLNYLAVDANGKLGSVRSQAVGTVRVDSDNNTGLRLRCLLETFRLKAYNTMYDSICILSGSHAI